MFKPKSLKRIKFQNYNEILAIVLKKLSLDKLRGYRYPSILERFRSHRLRCWQHYFQGGLPCQTPFLNLSSSDQAIVKELQRQGGVQTSLEALDLTLNENLMKAAKAFAAQLPSTSDDSNSHLGHCIHGDAATIVQDYPEIFLWGLQDRLLDMIENYIQLPVSYLGVDLRKDIPDGKQLGTRFWHTDGEDTCVVKIAIYLSDVEQEHGPFEYISKTQFNAAYRYLSPTYLRKNFRQPLLDDKHMGNIISPQRWTSCVGPVGTAVIVDTANVLHHGAVPSKERIALFFTYATRTPKNLAFCKECFPAEHLLPRFQDRLSKRQWDCLWAWRQVEMAHDSVSKPLTVITSPDAETLRSQVTEDCCCVELLGSSTL